VFAGYLDSPFAFVPSPACLDWLPVLDPLPVFGLGITQKLHLDLNLFVSEQFVKDMSLDLFN